MKTKLKATQFCTPKESKQKYVTVIFQSTSVGLGKPSHTWHVFLHNISIVPSMSYMLKSPLSSSESISSTEEKHPKWHKALLLNSHSIHLREKWTDKRICSDLPGSMTSTLTSHKTCCINDTSKAHSMLNNSIARHSWGIGNPRLISSLIFGITQLP